MIDHVSVAVRDLGKSQAFYSAVLAPLGYVKLREWPDAAVGFGKKHPEFWLNQRSAMDEVAPDSGVHICLRAPDTAAVEIGGWRLWSGDKNRARKALSTKTAAKKLCVATALAVPSKRIPPGK